MFRWIYVKDSAYGAMLETVVWAARNTSMQIMFKLEIMSSVSGDPTIIVHMRYNYSCYIL